MIINKQSKNNILIIEDEYSISNILRYALVKEGFIIHTAYNGEEGLEKLEENQIDLILLDIMLPDWNGFELCKKIMSLYQISIIFITARIDIMDKVVGLELGADDYIVKPFDIREVIARVKSVIRRLEKVEQLNSKKNHLQINKYTTLHKDERKIYKNEKEIKLTRKEFDLLLLFAENSGTVFSRDFLLDRIWGYDYIGNTRTVDIHITRIRKKLGYNKDESLIETLYGVGYRLCKDG